MDGVEVEVPVSLRSRLSLWVSLVILAVALIAGIFSFVAAFEEANEWQDDMLGQAAILSGRQVPDINGDSSPAGNSNGDHIFVQLIKPGQTFLGNNPDARLELPANLTEGIQTVRIGEDSYRVLVKTLGTGERLAVAQSTTERDEMARDSALRTLLPFLILVPLLLLIVRRLIRLILKPVVDVANEIDRRGETELHPVSHEALPAEITPFVAAINRLLRRVAQSMAKERRFVADAAHELRSPLTALSLQAEHLASAELPVTARERLDDLRGGIDRSRDLLDQLLALARAQTDFGHVAVSVSLQHVFRHVLEDLMPLAEDKGLDIGVVGDTDAEVNACEFDVITLVRNLVTNAINFTPPGGRIDLSVEKKHNEIILRVKDNGPGIPEKERERVFDPFYRILGNDETGSGLGLSIVHTIAVRIGAVVRLEYSNKISGAGLCVTVIFARP